MVLCRSVLCYILCKQVKAEQRPNSTGRILHINEENTFSIVGPINKNQNCASILFTTRYQVERT